jgi:holo-[acyl-carrier protein] synthase
MNPAPLLRAVPAPPPMACGRTRVGVDIVQISRIADSVAQFGDRFMQRLFTPSELAYATAVPALVAERLAARFAAKEAALKAFGLCEAGIDWRELEVRRRDDGACRLVLHGKAAEHAGAQDNEAALSLSHDGDYAVAVVAAAELPNSSLSIQAIAP